MENPFTFKMGQVMTGFGVGCGIGIGVGSPINLGGIPGVDQVMSATRGASLALSDVSRHVNATFGKLGIKGVQAGVGCGIGFGHGFGAGLAVKPGAVHQLQACIGQGLVTIMKKLNLVPDPSVLGKLPSVGESMHAASEAGKALQNPIGKLAQTGSIDYPNLLGKTTEMQSQKIDRSVKESMTSALKSDFLKLAIGSSPRMTEAQVQEEVDRLKTENRIMETLLKHQKILEELQESNHVIQRVLVEELGVSPEKFEKKDMFEIRAQSCGFDCFECRRRARRRTK